MDYNNPALLDMIPDDLRPQAGSFISEAALLEALVQKVVWMLQYNNGVFFQLMYKIDIPEDQLQTALHSNDVPMALSRLILDKKIRSLHSRRDNPAGPAVDEDLKW